jgi:hypothetical protein
MFPPFESKATELYTGRDGGQIRGGIASSAAFIDRGNHSTVLHSTFCPLFQALPAVSVVLPRFLQN